MFHHCHMQNVSMRCGFQQTLYSVYHISVLIMLYINHRTTYDEEVILGEYLLCRRSCQFEKQLNGKSKIYLKISILISAFRGPYLTFGKMKLKYSSPTNICNPVTITAVDFPITKKAQSVMYKGREY
uniref:Uncharacterized protein n=1 Tax=Glossina austeni TaxID=7395 RepID=A0A1A9UP67_GLOAU